MPERRAAPKPVARTTTGMTRMEALDELNRAKTALINTAAHELSTPIMPIRLQTEILRSGRLGPLTKDQLNALDILERNVQRLTHVVQDLLDVANAEASRMPMPRDEVDLSRAAAEALDALLPAARQAGVTAKLSTDASLLVAGDMVRLRQVFSILIENAIKFTPSGGSVTVSTRREGNIVVGAVLDTGVGLKPEDFQQLFQPFGQAFNTMEKTRAGAGLGLTIAQGIIEQHGGRIWCDSPGPGRGATFSFAVPSAGASREAAHTMMRQVMTRFQQKETIPRTSWSIMFFRCPQCATRDIQMRILKNKYECNRCGHSWR